jgi:hypothetical protein
MFKDSFSRYMGRGDRIRRWLFTSAVMDGKPVRLLNHGRIAATSPIMTPITSESLPDSASCEAP